MSSMHNFPGNKYVFGGLFLATAGLALGAPAATRDAAAWDMARVQMVAQQPTNISLAISRWEELTRNDRLGFADYSGFLLAYPDFPRDG
ncbi:MAG TPA: hypothetical protein VK839_08460, partial [Erythrobacter sp.]|nr:hypothetical protein [Erythrobacter sp.]